MSWLNLQTAKRFTRVLVFFFAFFAHVTVKAWDVDFSRRSQDLKKSRGPGSVAPSPQPENLINSFFESVGPTQEIVILNTEKGFVPETLRLRKGQSYRIHVVNVNEKEKNVSFVMDAFGEHHGTYYGQPKAFSISPKVDGIFSFQCPETSKQGRIVVIPQDDRQPATE